MLVKKSQVLDYKYRPRALEEFSVWEYFTHTYETDHTEADEPGATQNNRGHLKKPQFDYVEEHPQSKVAI